MMYIGGGEGAAGGAVAAILQGGLRFAVLGLGDIIAAPVREDGAVAGHSGRQSTVKEVKACGHGPHQVLGRAGAHHVAGLGTGKLGGRMLRHPVREGLGLADGEAPHGVAIEADAGDGLDGLVPQGQVRAALDDAEQGLVVASASVAGAARPAVGALHGPSQRIGVGAVADALVQHHGDVHAKGLLVPHSELRREEALGAVDMGADEQAVFGDAAEHTQGVGLEAARVGEDGAVPSHEGVQASEALHGLDAGPQGEVVGVRQDDVGAQLPGLLGRKGLDGALGGDGHEGGGGHAPVGRGEQPGAGVAAGGLELEGDG